jgi:hypothetical protein
MRDSSQPIRLLRVDDDDISIEKKHQPSNVARIHKTRLEDESGTLGLLVTTQLEVLATLERKLCLGLACCALQSQDNLLGGLGLLVEDRLGLTTVTGLLTVVTTLTLGEEGSLASLVLGDLVLGVLLAVLALAVGAASLGNVDLKSAP